MTQALLVSNVLLWLAVIVLAGVVLALLRQIGVLHERIAPAGALTTSTGPAVGDTAPVVEASDWSGAPVQIGSSNDAGRSTLLVFVSPTCPVCNTLLPALESLKRAEARWLDVVLASDGPRAEHEAFVRSHDLARFGYLLSTRLGLAHQVGRLPHAVLIDAGGFVRAKGLVNSREHLESLVVAMHHDVASLQDYLAERDGEERVATGGAA